MAGTRPAQVFQYLRTLLSARGTDPSSDEQLLQRFVDQRDEAAFTALLQRHGPVVLGVCRRLLADPHDVEDAFQATFLVLARRAGAVARRERVGSWLFGVAYRIAARLRGQVVRRRVRQRQLSDSPAREEQPEIVGREARGILDEEVQRLPEKYRTPFILCHLRGLTQEEAAHELGCPKGTVASRVMRACQRLRARLSRRDLTIPPTLFGTLLGAEVAEAALPGALAGATVTAACAFASGRHEATGAASARVLMLCRKNLEELMLARIKHVVAAVLTVVVAGTGAVLAYQARPPVPPEAAKGPEKNAPEAKAAEPLPAAWKEQATLPVNQHTRSVWTLAFSPDGKTLATAGSDGRVMLWDPATGKEQGAFKGHRSQVIVVAFAPDGKTAASVSDDGVLLTWDPATRKARTTTRVPAGQQGWSLAFTADGKTLVGASGGDGTVQLWNAATGKAQGAFREHMGQVTFVALLADGKTIASGDLNGAIKLWDPATLKAKQTFQRPNVLTEEEILNMDEFRAVSPDGKTAVSRTGLFGRSGTVKLWDLESGKVRATLKGHEAAGGSTAFSSDGRVLATAATDGTVKLWDVVTGKELATLKQPNAVPLVPVAFAPSGYRLATATEGGVKVWDAGTKGKSGSGDR
jgi:RNA polymerase sigma factor (sigma-70 family)